METEEVSEMLVSSSTLTCLNAQKDVSTHSILLAAAHTLISIIIYALMWELYHVLSPWEFVHEELTFDRGSLCSFWSYLFHLDAEIL